MFEKLVWNVQYLIPLDSTVGCFQKLVTPDTCSNSLTQSRHTADSWNTKRVVNMEICIRSKVQY
jgi:hypothetical protein